MYMLQYLFFTIFFFFNDTATTEIYTLSLHDALPISRQLRRKSVARFRTSRMHANLGEIEQVIEEPHIPVRFRSEEHTSELQSRLHLVCRLLLEKKKKPITKMTSNTITKV